MIGRNKAKAAPDIPTMQYANGKTLARAGGSTGRFAPHVGFHVEVGKNTDVDHAMSRARIGQIEIKHQRQGGAEIVRHWSLGETIKIYPVTSGPVALTVAGSLSAANAAQTAEAGIGLRWGDNERSKMAVRCFIDPLVRVGGMQLFSLSVRSRMTDVLLGALLDHGRVCEAADSLIDRDLHPEVVTYHELALILAPGTEEEWGKGDTATVVPFRSLHPAEVSRDYVIKIWRPKVVHTAALEAWAGVQEWAREFAATAVDEA